MNNSDKYKKLAKNTLLIAVGSFGARALSFFLVPFCTNYLSTEAYGVADIIQTTVLLLTPVLTLNINMAVFLFALDKQGDPEEMLRYGEKLTVIGTLILSAGVLVPFLLNIFSVQPYCYLFLIIIFFTESLYYLLASYLRGTDQVAVYAVMGVIQSVTLFAVAVGGFIWLNAGLFGYLLSIALGFVAANLFVMIVLLRRKKDRKKRRPLTGDTKKAMLLYSIPLIFNSIAWWINTSVDRYFVGMILGVGQTGIYSAATKISNIFIVVAQFFLQAWGISSVVEYDREDKDGFFANMYSLFNTAVLVLCSVLVLINIPVAKILYAKDFYEAWQYSSILLYANVFNVLGNFVGSVFTAVKDSKAYAVTTIIAAAANVLMNLLLIPKFGVYGAALATLLSFFLIWVTRFVYVRKYIRWKVHLIRDVICYAALFGQIAAEHISGHGYYFQAAALAVIIILNFGDLRKTCRKLWHILGKKLRRAK